MFGLSSMHVHQNNSTYDVNMVHTCVVHIVVYVLGDNCQQSQVYYILI